MEKSWEQKLAERQQFDNATKIMEEESCAKKSGNPHLLNLNEDPMLDRHVVYEIVDENPLFCGRRNKQSNYKLQLSGMGIQAEHCKFLSFENGKTVQVVPLDEKAIQFIKINGKSLTDMSARNLKPNDRICIGPSAIFLLKNMNFEHLAEIQDTHEDHITFEFAEAEVADGEIENKKEEKEALKKQQQEESQQAVKDL